MIALAVSRLRSVKAPPWAVEGLAKRRVFQSFYFEDDDFRPWPNLPTDPR